MKRVVCFGSAIVDLMVKSKDFRVMKSHQVTGGVALCEVYGGKTEVDEIKMAIGGAGTNVAVGLKRLGIESACVVRIGDDMFGSEVLNNLKKEGVETSLVQIQEGGDTGMSVVLVASDGGRSILTKRGVSKEIKSAEVDWEKIKNVDWIQISSLGGNVELLEDIVAWANLNQIKVGLNPGKQELDQRDRLKKLLPKIELLIINSLEVTSLIGHELDQVKEATKKMLDLGVKMVVVTDGKNGAGVGLSDRWIWSKAFRVRSLDDTGAGDAFCSGMVAGILKGWEVEKALKLGLANGASEVEQLGVKEGLLFEKQIDRWMKKKTLLIEERYYT